MRPPALPPVKPHLERGRLYRTEYEWQEQMCSEVAHDVSACGCSDYHRLVHRTYDFWKPSRHCHVDTLVSAREAVELVRTYLPDVTTEDQLFKLTAWEPFKAILRNRPSSVYYTNFSLMIWAKARAGRRRAPWAA